jgi:hypothetical protein
MTHFDDIRTTLIHARLCYEAWWFIESHHPHRKQVVSVFNRYKGFFATVRPALFTAFVVKLASLYGTRSDEISFKRVPNIDQIAGFASLWARGRKFHKYRSRVIAHRDVDNVHRTFVAESGCPTYNDLKALLDDTCALFEAAAEQSGADGLPPFTAADDLLSPVLDLTRHPDA